MKNRKREQMGIEEILTWISRSGLHRVKWCIKRTLTQAHAR